MLIGLLRVQDAQDAMKELSDRPKLPPPLVAPPTPSLLPSLQAGTAAAAAGGGAADEERSLAEGAAAAGSAAPAALSGPAGTAPGLQVPCACHWRSTAINQSAEGCGLHTSVNSLLVNHVSLTVAISRIRTHLDLHESSSTSTALPCRQAGAAGAARWSACDPGTVAERHRHRRWSARAAGASPV